MELGKGLNIVSFFESAKKKGRTLILDGAMGSVIQKEYPSLHSFIIWMSQALIHHPDFIRNLHLDYINSGCDIITSCTFRTNPHALKAHTEKQYSCEEMVKLAVSLCHEAKKIAKDQSKPVLIAGSNAPIKQCYSGSLEGITKEELYENHEVHIENLWKNGVDFILNETFSNLEESEIVCEICDKKKLPFVISLFCDDNLKMISGESLQEAIERVQKFKPLAISFNCIKFSVMKKILKEVNLEKLTWGCYINCGDEKMQETYVEKKGKVDHEMLDFKMSPQDLQNLAKEIVYDLKLSPIFIGSCCCSFPEHSKKLSELFNK